jgi:hypothetical protein
LCQKLNSLSCEITFASLSFVKSKNPHLWAWVKMTTIMEATSLTGSYTDDQINLGGMDHVATGKGKEKKKHFWLVRVMCPFRWHLHEPGERDKFSWKWKHGFQVIHPNK